MEHKTQLSGESNYMNDQKMNRRTADNPLLRHTFRWMLLCAMLAMIALAGSNILAAAPTVDLPIGADSYKIAVDTDGVYSLTYADLQAAGMAVDTVNPTTFQMMHQGSDVAYVLTGDGDDVFEPGESVLFYGWGLDGSDDERQAAADNGWSFTANNHDRMYVDQNFFWIWADGTPTAPTSKLNLAGNTNVVNTFRDIVVHDEDDRFSYTNSDDWDEYEIESTSWFKTLMASNYAPLGDPFRTFPIEIIDPDPSGDDGTINVELYGVCKASEMGEHAFQVDFAGSSIISTWEGRFGKLVQNSFSAASLVDGMNDLYLETITPVGNAKPGTSICASGTLNSDLVFYNRAIIEYDRQMNAVNNELIFDYDDSGTFDFVVSEFTEGDPAKAIVWNITNRLVPANIPMSANEISSNGGTFSWTIGDENVPGGQYIATTTDNLLSAASIEQYTVNNVEPTGGAEWVAISHGNFITEALRLETHRQSAGRTTHVVDVEDVINQYGYGYHVPKAIENYVDNAYTTWTDALKYLLLFGDATIDPLQRECLESCNGGGWGTHMETYVVTDLLYEDRFSGLVPTDHTFADITGDVSPEIAVGRFAVSTLQEANNVVDKTILYEQNIIDEAEYLQNLAFLADRADGGGDFCQTTKDVSENPYYVGEFTGEISTFCLDQDYTDQGVAFDDALVDINADVFNSINNDGAAILNYRGHGAAENWGLSHIIVDWASHSDSWDNAGQPVVIISADCLEGNFANTADRLQGLAEKFIELEDVGTAAHWSSTGLGFDREHTALHQGFYEGLYTENGGTLTTIGDGIVYAKTRYVDGTLGNEAEIWAFTLQGDPALMMPNTVVAPEPTSVSVSQQQSDMPFAWQWAAVLPVVVVLTVGTVNARRRQEEVLL